MSTSYRVGLTRDGFRPSGESIFGDLGLHRLEEADVSWRLLPELTNPVDPRALAGLDAVLSFGHLHFDRATVDQAPQLQLIARFGAGYDGIDLDGLAAAGVAVTNTPTAVRGPQALATLTMILALSHNLLDNHRSAVSGAWATGRGMYRGLGVRGRTLGIVGFGSVGGELARLARPLGYTVVATDRPENKSRVEQQGVEFVSHLDLAARADYVVVAAALTESTRHMISNTFLDAMKRTAYLVNTSRGELVDPVALLAALQSGSIAGAGLDVIDPEPPAPDDPLLAMQNVVFSPHCLCWTEDFTRDVSTSALESIIDAARGHRPQHTLNPAVYTKGWRRDITGLGLPVQT